MDLFVLFFCQHKGPKKSKPKIPRKIHPGLCAEKFLSDFCSSLFLANRPLTPTFLENIEMHPPFCHDTLAKVCPPLGRKEYFRHQLVSRDGSHLYRDAFAEVLGSGVVGTPQVTPRNFESGDPSSSGGMPAALLSVWAAGIGNTNLYPSANMQMSMKPSCQQD